MNEGRREILQIVFVLIGIVFLIKLFFIQIVDNKYKDLADSNAILPQVEYPSRGLIYDRKGQLIAFNTPEFDVEVIMQDAKNFNEQRFCEVFHMSKPQLDKAFDDMKHRKEYSRFKPTVLIDQLSVEDYARVSDHMDEFPGFYIVPRTGRAYSTGSLANALGYVSEVSKNQLENDSSNLYKQGDYIGQSGIEAYYEEVLRGTRGIRYKLRNVKGVEKGSWSNGDYDTLSIPGTDLVTGIDLELQQYAEYLLKGKSGSIVAIEPATGEILTFVSGPSYDPNQLTGRKYSNNYKLISGDTMKPLFNRPLMAQYRPGSIFKIAQAMSALQMGVITPETRIFCDRGHPMACHGNHTNEDLRGAITNSCNPYFYNVLRRMVNKGKTNDPFTDSRIGLADWNQYIQSFGFGQRLGIDLPNEKAGLVPTPAYYDRAYRGRPWKFSNIYSISIGEGENLVVPLQMANFAAIVANRGYYITPHIVKSIGENGKALPQYAEKHYTKIDAKYFDIAVDAMEAVVDHGTATRAKIPDMIVCGKTGTVQNEPRPTHSVFIAFAPRENPKIAISVYVEYAGQGARAAASIASLLMEKYMTGEVKRKYLEDYVIAGKFL
jgi:penicillin-binding protein 2